MIIANLLNKSRLFHCCIYNKQNIACQLVDMKFNFSCSTRYLCLNEISAAIIFTFFNSIFILSIFS